MKYRCDQNDRMNIWVEKKGGCDLREKEICDVVWNKKDMH